MDKAFREQIAQRFQAAIDRQGLSRAQAAKDLNVSRQMLHRYLSRESIPGSAVLHRACKKWGITLNHKGIEFPATAFEKGKSPGPLSGVQLSLFDAIVGLENENLEVKVLRRKPGSVELIVQIRFAS